jgi:hypothetical protein
MEKGNKRSLGNSIYRDPEEPRLGRIIIRSWKYLLNIFLLSK